MQYKSVTSNEIKTIALVAHDNMKGDLISWVKEHEKKLSPHKLFATGTTGALLSKETGLTISKLISGPLGGDQQIGAYIAERKIDMLVFFWDPLEAQPHDPDVKALLRLGAVWNIPLACNYTSAEFLINSTLFDKSYVKSIPDYDSYLAERAE